MTRPGHSWAVSAGPASGPVAGVLARCAEATLLLDADGRVVYAAAAVEPLLGVAPAALLGCPLRDLCAEPAGVDAALAAPHGEARSLPWQHAGGRRVALDVVTDRLDATGAVATLRDGATAAAVDAVRAASADGRAVAVPDDVPLVVFVLDVRGACTRIGVRWADVTGQDDAAARGVGWLTAVVEDDRAGLRGVAGRAHAERRPWRHRFRLVRGDGRVAWVDAAAEPLTGPDGGFAGYVGVVADVTADVTA